jgi:hypothetical protein
MSLTKRQQRRDEITATFELYGWRPMSVVGRRGVTAETLVCDEAGRMLRVVKQAGGQIAIYNALNRTKRRLELRHPREWGDITLPRLQLMHARLMQLLCKGHEAKVDGEQP